MNSTEARLDHANGFKHKTLSARLGIIQFQIPRCAYLIMDARYEKVRHGERVLDCARLIALGIRRDGKRMDRLD